jgi:trans-aconitate methyltransferase
MTGQASQHSGQTGWCPSWDGSAYAANTGHHRAQDAAFLADLPLRSTDRLLDLGCGSGDFTRILADLVADGVVVGVDPQPSMLAEARGRAAANQRFALGTGQALAAAVAALEPAFDGPAFDVPAFDVIVSRATLHWVPAGDVPAVYANVFGLLRPGGWFRFECGGAGNIAASLAVMDAESARVGGPQGPWNFAGSGWALDRLEEAGFDVRAGFVRQVAQRRTFDRDGVLGWMRSQVFNAYTDAMTAGDAASFTAAVEARVDELVRHDGTFDQTWVRLDALVQRPV